jgi:hypothetical protein
MMKRISLVIAVLSLATGGRAEAGSTSFGYTAGTGTTFAAPTNGAGQLGAPYGTLCDGTALANCATVKAASTPAAAGDTSITIQLSPAQPNLTTPLNVTGSGGTFPVTGTFWQSTQPVSIATAPALVAGSATIGKVGIDQSAPGTTNGVQSKVWDGTNVAAVKAASTAPAATDPALVVDISPNCAVCGAGPTGSAAPANANYIGGVSSGNLTGIIQADKSAPINVSTATTTVLVALTSGKAIYVTAYDFTNAGTADNVTLEYGTGTACATGTTALTGPYATGANLPGIVKGGGLGPILFVPAGNALCMVTSAAQQISGSLSYTVF